MSSSLVVYTPPPAVARAFKDRGYTSLQLESYARHLERQRMFNPPPLPPSPPTVKVVYVEPPPPPPPPPPKLRRMIPNLMPWHLEPEQIIFDARKGIFRSVDEIIKLAVCAEFRISVAQMVAVSRKASVVFPRQIAMYLARMLMPDASYPRIGQIFVRSGRPARDHTTILHAFRKIEGMMLEDEVFADGIERLQAKIVALLEEKRRRMVAIAVVSDGGHPAMTREAADPGSLAVQPHANALEAAAITEPLR